MPRMTSRESLDILFNDDHFVAVQKPAGLATIPGRAEVTSVLETLAAQLNLPCTGDADPRLRVVHRLDKDTTGALLFAKSRAAQQHVSHQFQNNLVKKEYVAIVRGSPEQDAGDIEAALSPHPTNPKRMAVIKHAGRPARTLWKVEQRFRGYALIRCFPQTGKTHQIRVHLAHVGLPLAIDPLYGEPGGLFLSSFKRDYRPTRGQDERPLIDRLTLHAEKLTFTHLTGQAVELLAPLPKDFRATVNQLSRHARR